MSHDATVSNTIEEDTSKMAPTPTLGTSINTETAGEIPLHTQQLNTYDPILQQQFIVTQQGSWSTNMVAGYSLFRLPVHPSSCNQYIKYLSGLYGVWGGSIEFQVIIAGTGFNGGKMLLVKTPPYTDATKMTLADLMIFPNRIIDVKAQEAFGVVAQDQRPINYHQVNVPPTPVTLTVDTSFMQMTSTGGWISLVVLNPLISANMSVGSVTWTLMTRLGEDFQFNQMVPPHINTDVTTTFPTLYLSNYPSFEHGTDNAFTTLILSTKVTDTNTTRVNMYDTEGNGEYSALHFDSFIGKELTNTATGKYSIDTSAMTQFSKVNYGTDQRFKLKTTTTDFNGITDVKITPNTFTFSNTKQTNTPGKVQYIWPLREDVPNDNTISGTGYSSFQAISTNRNECFVYYNFSNGADGFGFFQDEVLRNFLVTVKPGKSMDLVYVIKQKSNNAPLAYLRLNPQGFWSCAKSSVARKFNISTIYLQYFTEIEPNSSLPKEPENMDMARSLYSLQTEMAQMRQLRESYVTLSSAAYSDVE